MKTKPRKDFQMMVRVTKEQIQEFRALAEAEGECVSVLVRRLIRAGLDVERAKPAHV